MSRPPDPDDSLAHRSVERVPILEFAFRDGIESDGGRRCHGVSLCSGVGIASGRDVPCSLVVVTLLQATPVFLRCRPTAQALLQLRSVLSFVCTLSRQKLIDSITIRLANATRLGLDCCVPQPRLCCNRCRHPSSLLRRAERDGSSAKRPRQEERAQPQNHFAHDVPPCSAICRRRRLSDTAARSTALPKARSRAGSSRCAPTRARSARTPASTSPRPR